MDDMDNKGIYIGPQTIMRDWGVSRATAYNMIRALNRDLKAACPTALVIPGKVNRIWYDQACLKHEITRR